MKARKADCAYLSDVGLFRYLIFAYCDRTSDDWPVAMIATIGREIKILSFHVHHSELKIARKTA